ncbi:Crp/Fnr family transcriptional regulator [Caenimonas koreensis]|uniref:Cyclic nucleotide-binding domain-containing protein n=1 Tax=Caenimonas koreensis DSM 17982 TaxID=1121255 RepID=A0A844B8A4_9BURK|nr:cyclic nucleotide-binding domain-containing protein [Caenimonas koreensis]MRD46761.1 cyclic nucleotide-binding domain-containing protein [Caenimonas koreensis DSM 17982]
MLDEPAALGETRLDPASAGTARICADRLRDVVQSASAELAADLLRAPSALMQLSHEEALAVVACMEPRLIAEGETFIHEGDKDNTGFMLLILDGEVTVESSVVHRDDPITCRILGAGSLIGEIGLIDGSARSASCTAMTDLRCAMLSRDALNGLLDADPRTAAKLMMAISHRIAQRIRANHDRLKLYSQLTLAMNEEIHFLMPF